MAPTRLSALAWGLILTWSVLAPARLMAADFSDEALALPYAPDAVRLEFHSGFRTVQYYSFSPLKSLAAFYLKEMAGRGWEHDEAAAKVEEDSIELRFKHGKAEAKIRFKQDRKEVRVSMDTEGLKFTDINDPAKLAAAGLSVPRATLFFQKEMPPMPDGVKDLQYSGDRCIFKLPAMTLQETFDHFSRVVVAKGFKESRKPILNDTRRYTEFKKGAALVSVNVFTDGAGSRAVLEYKDDTKETPKPPLAAVATLPIKGAEALGGNDTPVAPANATPVDVTTNKGSATVNYNGKVYTFPHVASFQTKDRAGATMLVFSAKPIPLNRMQTLIATKKSFSFGDLYENSAPERLVVQLGDYLGFTFNLSNVVVGNSIDNPVNELKVEGGRVQGTLKMPPREVFKGEQLSFSVTANAVIMTPTTRIKGPADLAETSDISILADSPVPFPLKTESVSREGSKFRKTYSATVNMPREEVAAFYRKALAEKGWKPTAAETAGQPMQFKNDTSELSVTLEPKGDKTAIKVLTRDIALAKAEGILPEAGKGRLILANAHNVAVVYTIGKTDYPLKPGQGEKDFKQALNYSIAPATYTVIVKVPGQPQQTQQVELTAGSTWAIVVLPTGDCMPVPLY